MTGYVYFSFCTCPRQLVGLYLALMGNHFKNWTIFIGLENLISQLLLHKLLPICKRWAWVF